ncbi:hypothetical protein CW751_03015 [Brumimicrobium salinarum]|uniref:Ppx/GppA phosphatase N-terminal domain-containing protein n=1 Tax=Brumimicrobium salinarum TaxID=2058658 RepID=A0A2I0R6Z2_9FLAO|nr:hypothetical protein [Brumimicrobium salinarum]PKR82319.1 hypothetical protein CW751_03015 [Brumimicrobium salinarum]
MRGAVIDLGTNTFGLIVFEIHGSGFKVLLTDKSFVDLGKGGINSNYIADEAMERAIFALDHFIDSCRAYEVYPNMIRAFGTSALRDAKNGQVLLKHMKTYHQLDIQLINGVQEANLVYEGVRAIHDFSEDSSCIMDIGGGSTEFTVTKCHKIVDQKSFNIGISRIIQLFELSDPLCSNDIKRIKLFLEVQTKDYFKTLKVDELIGAAGSFETYFLLLNKTSAYDNYKTHLLPLDELNKMLDYLIFSTREERNNDYWIADYRKDMINVAAYKTKWILDQIGASACCFSPAGIKEGVIATAFKR